MRYTIAIMILTSWLIGCATTTPEQLKAQSEQNRREAEAFLANNKHKPDVVETASGLQYQIIQKGSGAKPTMRDIVHVHYSGHVLGETEPFDASNKGGAPHSAPLRALIKGWQEGLQLMPVGSTFRFYIPPTLAYGEKGAGPKVGPNKLLIYEVELFKVEKDVQNYF